MVNDRTPEDPGSNTAMVVLVVILIAVLIGVFFWWGGGDDEEVEVDLPDEVGLVERAAAGSLAAEIGAIRAPGGSAAIVTLREAPAA